MTTPLRVVIGGPSGDGLATDLRDATAPDEVQITLVETDVGGASAEAHLCIAVGHLADTEIAAADVAVPHPPTAAATSDLLDTRIRPFARNLASGKRAPRRRQAVLFPYDADWPVQAARLIARLRKAVPDAERFDHIGSTSVPGMHAKDLIDLQLVVSDLGAAELAAQACAAAGFVSAGLIYDINKYGEKVAEYCACDADPGRPVNVHIRPRDSVVWRETLLLRDWLRVHPAGREEYVELKRRLASVPGGNVDQYSDEKMPWIASALERAERWAAREMWAPSHS